MKRVAALGLALFFALTIFHFYFGEDHCPIHCPVRCGHLGHVHHHHPGAEVCLCFLTALAAPESADLPMAAELLAVLEPPAPAHVLGMTAPDITPPPRSSSI
jgi:hypothetical protein